MGGQLTPPASVERWRQLPRWRERTVVLQGSTWEKSTADVCIAGGVWGCVCVCCRSEDVVGMLGRRRVALVWKVLGILLWLG